MPMPYPPDDAGAMLAAPVCTSLAPISASAPLAPMATPAAAGTAAAARRPWCLQPASPFAALADLPSRRAFERLYAERARRAGLGRWLRLLLPGLHPAVETAPSAAGALMYQLAIAIDARLIVALGTGDGLGAAWLASALRACGRRRGHARGDRALLGLEPDAAQVRQARRAVRAARVSRYVDIREDPHVQGLRVVDEPIDCLYVAAYPEHALSALQALLPRLRRGALVLTDPALSLPARRGRRDLRDYDAFLHSADSGLSSVWLPAPLGLGLSLKI